MHGGFRVRLDTLVVAFIKNITPYLIGRRRFEHQLKEELAKRHHGATGADPTPNELPRGQQPLAFLEVNGVSHGIFMCMAACMIFLSAQLGSLVQRYEARHRN